MDSSVMGTPAAALDDFVREICKGWIFQDAIWLSPKKNKVSYPDIRRSQIFEIESRSFWFEHRLRCLKTIFRRFPPHGFFLDVGGGNGVLTQSLSEMGIPAVLVEPGLESCCNARQRSLAPVLCGSIEELCFKSRQAWGVGLFDVLEHIAEELPFLKNVWNALAPGGKLYLSVPAFEPLWSHIDQEAGHFRRYTQKSLTRRLEESGFRVLYASYFFSWLPFPLFFLRTVPFWLRLVKARPSADIPKAHHLGWSPILRHWVLRFFAWEVGRLRTKSIPLGTSLVCVAEKICPAKETFV